MIEYTKGEWKVEDETNIFCGDRLIATAGGYADNFTSPREENKANANLIASAPDLYEALKLYFALCGNTAYQVDREGLRRAWDKARQALAKAGGK